MARGRPDGVRPGPRHARGRSSLPPAQIQAQVQSSPSPSQVQSQPASPAPRPRARRRRPRPSRVAPTDGPGAVISAETRAARAKLDGYKVELDQKELTLQGRPLSDAELQALREQIEPLAVNIGAVISLQTPRLEASRARLSQLGPKPAQGQPEESADVARDRMEREAAVAELDETQRLGRALLVQAEQLATQITDRRRIAFTNALFEESEGLLSPGLWLSALASRSRGSCAPSGSRSRTCSSTSSATARPAASCSSGFPSASRSPSTSGGAPSRPGSSGATTR